MTYYLLFLLMGGVSLIIWLTAFKKLNAFFALLIAALAVGIFSGLSLAEIVTSLKAGFGHTMEKIGLLIILGTALGIVLEKTGATLAMANFIIQKVSERHAPAAISITGFIIGLPIFCDSGFIILNGLNHSLVQRTKIPMSIMAPALATSLYAVHCLVPPHPGITAAVGTVGGDIGSVMLIGIFLAIPAALVGFWWSTRQGKMMAAESGSSHQPQPSANNHLPGVVHAFIPVILPIGLIALKSVVLLITDDTADASQLLQFVSFIGEPVVALMIALLISMTLIRKSEKPALNHWLTEGIEKAGMVLAIIAGGGMFGEMLQQTGMGKNLGELLSGLSLGIFFPFLITAVLKTAQGSSTVAIITAASLVTPLLKDLGLDTSFETTMAILSMGAGSMVVSHANDAYFWVISKFSALETSSTLKVYSMATLGMGTVVQLLIWITLMIV
jgi:gluconate:H+ symporter, GntP family